MFEQAYDKTNAHFIFVYIKLFWLRWKTLLFFMRISTYMFFIRFIYEISKNKTYQYHKYKIGTRTMRITFLFIQLMVSSTSSFSSRFHTYLSITPFYFLFLVSSNSDINYCFLHSMHIYVSHSVTSIFLFLGIMTSINLKMFGNES